MKIWPSQDRARLLAIAFASGAALLCASLTNFLHHNEYPLLRPEVGIIVAALLAICVGMAFFYTSQRHWGRSFLEGFLATLFVDLNADSLLLAAAVGAAVALLAWSRRTSLLGPMAVLGSVVLVTTVLGLGGTPHWIKVQRHAQPARRAIPTDKPAILHVILDEHIGIEGLPNEAESRRLRNEMRHFYLANRFVLYGGAYSQYYNTTNAIPNILNYGQRLAAKASKRGVRVGATEHLQTLVDRGYRLTIFQSNFADFCSDATFDECVTYDSGSLRPTLAVAMGVWDRTTLIAIKFLSLSDIGTSAMWFWNVGTLVFRGMGWALPVHGADTKASSTVGTLKAMDELTTRLRSMRSGDMIFAHLLLPHFPYVVRRDCSYLPWRDWEGRYPTSTLEGRREASYEQIRCTTQVLGTLLRALSQSPAGANAIVIVHGDHGSRIVRVSPQVANVGRITDEDMIAGFSTLFAARGPGIQPGYISDRQPVAALLRDFAASGFRFAPHPAPPKDHLVYVADSDWKPVRQVPLPANWTKRVDRPAAAH